MNVLLFIFDSKHLISLLEVGVYKVLVAFVRIVREDHEFRFHLQAVVS